MYFKDLNFNYKITSSSLLLEDEDVINQSLDKLFSTPKGIRMFNRNYGSSLENLTFENMTPALQDAISMVIYEEIKTFEPRVILRSVDDVSIEYDYDNNLLTLNISYKLKSNTSISGNFVKTIDISK